MPTVIGLSKDHCYTSEDNQQNLPTPRAITPLPSRRGAGSDTINPNLVNIYSKQRLRSELEKLGMPTDGTKDVLASRLHDVLLGIPIPVTKKPRRRNNFIKNEKKPKGRRGRPRKVIPREIEDQDELIDVEVCSNRTDGSLEEAEQYFNEIEQKVVQELRGNPAGEIIEESLHVPETRLLWLETQRSSPPPQLATFEESDLIKYEEIDMLSDEPASLEPEEDFIVGDADMPKITNKALDMSNVIFVLVPPAFQLGQCSYVTDVHSLLFRWIKSIGAEESIVINTEHDVRENETIWDAINHCIHVIKAEVQRVVREYREKRVVLVGWRLSCYLNHRVIQLVAGVNAIIDLAFSLKTQIGYRGEQDDDIVATYCPTLFIIGSFSSNFNPEALKAMRNNMKCTTGAVIVPQGDDHLKVPSHELNRLKITQIDIFKFIVEDIVEFLSLPATKRPRGMLYPRPMC